MKGLYETFFDLVKERIDKHKKMYAFGEDSIRYDFYHGAMTHYNLKSSDLILEQAIPPSQFQAKEREKETNKQGRNTDKPEFDLRIDPKNNLKDGILAEFAYFRGTEISKTQDRTARHGKLLNDIFRLALLKNFNNHEDTMIYKDFSDYKCLLICVTDEEMINYGHNERGPKSLPISDAYNLNRDYLNKLPKTANEQINKMFLDKVTELRITPTAERVYERIEESQGGLPKWAIWIWEISFNEET